MGFWSKLGKGLSFAAPLIPFVGPALGIGAKAAGAIGAAAGAAGHAASGGGSDKATAIGNVGQVVGGAASGLTDQRLQEARINQGRDQLALEQARLGISAPMDRAKQAAYGDALHNIQDVGIDFTPRTGALPKFNITGGLRPSMYGDTARQAGGELSKKALAAIMTGSDIPKISDYTKAGTGEKLAQGVGMGASVLGAIAPALANFMPNKPQAQAPAPPGVNPMVYGPSNEELGIPPTDEELQQLYDNQGWLGD